MKILVISQYYYPEQFRINDICEELAKRGNEITVLTGLPNYPEGKIYKGYETRYSEIKNGVKILRCRIYPRKKGNINLVLNYLSYSIVASKTIKQLDKSYDFVFVYQLSPVISAIPGIRYKKKFNKPLLMQCCDIWPESIKDVIKNENSIIFRITKSVSRRIYNKADLILVKSPSFVRYLTSVCKVKENMIRVVPEHAEDTYLTIDEQPIDNSCIDFMFLGNIGLAQDSEVILKATSLIDKSLSFKVHFVGDGSDLTRIKKITEDLNINDYVVFHGRHPMDEMPKYYALADVCLLTLTNQNATGLTIPAKLTGYMAASRPVVGAISGDARTLIEESNCGYCVKSGDYIGLSNIMTKCINESVKLIDLGRNGRDYFLTHFTKDIYIDKLEEYINKMVDFQDLGTTLEK